MRKKYDEPMFVNVTACDSQCAEKETLKEIQKLCDDQNFAVLATQGDGQPYTSLISFSVNDSLTKLYFSTPSQTRKFNLLEKNHLVSVLIDNRSDLPTGLNQISGLTITGTAKVLSDEDQIKKASVILLDKHPYLQRFIQSSTTKIIEVSAEHLYYVRRFQEVFEWSPR